MSPMPKAVWNYGLFVSAISNGFFLLSLTANASEVSNVSDIHAKEKISSNGDKAITISETDKLLSTTPSHQNSTNQGNQNNELAQVTSVSQFSDVQPTDWVFQALQSLVERYNVIGGYPDGTFRGNRTLTRYEFASALNTTLIRIEELIATSTADSVSQEDLATLDKLQKQFASELSILKGRVDKIESRTAKVEANSFSTTTKLVGDAILVVGDTFGKRANTTTPLPKDETNTFFAHRTRLTLQTSFNSKDLLVTQLVANGNIPNLNSSTGTHTTRFTFEPVTTGGDGVSLAQLHYRFPLGGKTTVWVGTVGLQPAVFTPTLNPSVGGFNGAPSRFATFNPTIYRPGFEGAGAAISYKFNNQIQLNAGYIGDNLNASNPGVGLFTGSFLSLAQLTISPSRQADIGLTYVRKYYIADSGRNLTGGTGSANAFRPFGDKPAFSADNLGFQFNWKASSRFALSGWFGYTKAHQESGDKNNATIINGALATTLLDLGKKGNIGGFVIGVPPKAISNTIANRQDNSTSLHLEAFYTHRINNNVSITPAIYVIDNPDHSSANGAIWVGSVRTGITF
ncbi:iron uptake porin [Cylindrospermopsis raciborskii UAM/DH-BiRr]|uniref:iron uptake porin n=1 Tax=Cylindrospermopsis raciborskii TaxID=77022 RepID=UPI003879BC4D